MLLKEVHSNYIVKVYEENLDYPEGADEDKKYTLVAMNAASGVPGYYALPFEQEEVNVDSLTVIDERVLNMTVSVSGYINPDSQSDVWTDDEKALAKGRAGTLANYLSHHGCQQRIDSLFCFHRNGLFLINQIKYTCNSCNTNNINC